MKKAMYLFTLAILTIGCSVRQDNIMLKEWNTPFQTPPFDEIKDEHFMPAFLEGSNKELFAAYLRTWYEKGTIPHIQFNVVDSEEMRDAQIKPEDHSDLIVRVAGYSAHFIDLPDHTQNSIIERTEQSFS